MTTSSSDEHGEFLIRGLDPGTYDLFFDAPGDTADFETTDVVVELGKVTDLGVVDLTP